MFSGDDPTAPVGHHHILELERCAAERLADPDAVSAAMRRAVERAGLTLLQQAVHAFAPHGVTAVALLAESHLSVHTWPEHGYAAVDLFSCGDPRQAEAACRDLAHALGAGKLALRVVRRGPSISGSDLDSATNAREVRTGQSREHSNSE